MSLKVLFNNILIKVIEDDSPIVISEEIHVPRKGVVIEVGEGTKSHPMIITPDSIVYFYQRDAQEITVSEDNKFYVLSQLDVLAYEEN